jgi:DNA invertase Pin-like site-specific DNA recombinase
MMPQVDAPPRILIWAAVSSKAQASEEKDSLPTQVADGKRWAADVGGEVVAVLKVPGHSRNYGFFADAEREMPAYRRLRELCEGRAFDRLWCRARDRLGRTDALIAQVEYLISEAGARIYSAAMPIEGGTETARLYLSGMERAGSQAFVVVMTEAHDRGMRSRVRRGLVASRWPYGYRPVRDNGGRVVGGEIVPEEAEALRLATRLFLEGQSYAKIADALNRSPWRPRNADRWMWNTLHRVLASDTYAGFPSYGASRPDEPSDRYPALWDAETYRAVVRERARRARGGRRPATIATGVVYCRRCGRTMVAAIIRRQRFYRCRTQCDQRHYGWGTCHWNYTLASRILAAIEDVVRWLAQVDGAVDKVLAQAIPERAELQTQIAEAVRGVEAAREKRKRLAMLAASDMMKPLPYRDADTVLEAEQRRAETWLAELREQLAVLPDPQERREALDALLAAPWARAEELRGPELERVRLALIHGGVRIWCEESRVVGATIGDVAPEF